MNVTDTHLFVGRYDDVAPLAAVGLEHARNAGLQTVADITRARLRAVAARHGGGLDERR